MSSEAINALERTELRIVLTLGARRRRRCPSASRENDATGEGDMISRPISVPLERSIVTRASMPYGFSRCVV